MKKLQRKQEMDKRIEGNALHAIHAEVCKGSGGAHAMSCRCWCHKITKYPNGEIREDAGAVELARRFDLLRETIENMQSSGAYDDEGVDIDGRRAAYEGGFDEAKDRLRAALREVI